MTVTVELPVVTHGRRWTVRKDGGVAWLCDRTGRRLGYVAVYETGWGANVATSRRGFTSWRLEDGQRYRGLPGEFRTRAEAASALLLAIRGDA